jgi:hypothetical protein
MGFYFDPVHFVFLMIWGCFRVIRWFRVVCIMFIRCF